MSDEKNISLYSELVQKFGADYRSLNWGSRDSQILRFRILTEIGNIRNASILDVGCGIGDLYGWLNQEGTSVDYTGIDITPAMVEAASKFYPGVKFLERNILASDLGKFDFVFASGIFTYRKLDGLEHFHSMIDQMFQLCNKGIAFNALSTWTPEPDEDEFYADPLEAVNFCKQITPWVSLRHDYHHGDFTIYLYRERNK